MRQWNRRFAGALRYWMVAPAAVLLQSLFLLRTWLKSSPPPINGVSIMFQYGGWLTTRGAVPYYHFIEIKPPLTFLTTGLLAHLTFGDTYTLHVVSVLLMCGAVVGIAVAIARLVFLLTESHASAVVAGLGVYVFPPFYNMPAHGFRTATAAMAVGLVGLLLVYEDRPLAAGVAGAASAGFWQLAVVFPLCILFLVGQRDRSRLQRTVPGMVGTTVVVLAPFAAVGALEDVFYATLVVPLTMRDSIALSSNIPRAIRPLHFLLVFGYASPLLLAGLFETVRSGLADRRRQWVALGSGWLLFQVFLLVFENWTDLQIVFVFALLGLGSLLAERSPRAQGLAAVVVVGLIGLNGIWVGGITVVDAGGVSVPPTEAEARGALPPGLAAPEGVASSPIDPALYWNERPPQSCEDPDFVFRSSPVPAPGCHEYPL